MMSGWDVYNEFADAGYSNQPAGVYFSGQDDGHQVKKGWVYTVPAYTIDSSAYNDDEEKYMYFNNSGDIVKDQFKKINGKYYVFNQNGIMKTGVVLWCTSANGIDGTGRKFVDTIDLDWAEGSDIAKKGILHLGKTDGGSNKLIYVDTNGVVDHQVNTGFGDIANKTIKLHLFGDDGARKTGMNSVEFSDDTFTLNTVGSSGDKGTGVFSKKYYTLGILLKASPDIRYGIYQTATKSMLKPQNGGTTWYTNENIDFKNELVAGDYIVLTSSGSKQKGNNAAKKDADGNYWMISSSDSSLKGIFTVGIKEKNSLSGFKTKTLEIPTTAFTNYANNAYTTQDLLDSPYTEDLFSTDIKNGDLIEIINATDAAGRATKQKWTLHRSGQGTSNVGTTCYFTCDYEGPCFQSDYGDGSNKWIPFGMVDNSYKTATFQFTSYQSDDSVGYAILKPNNDYFVNCYWND